MTDLEKDDTSSELGAGERKRRQKRILPKPLLRLLLILAVIVIVVVVIVFAARSAMHSSEAAEYQRYMTQVSEILQQSDAMGGELVNLLTNPSDTTTRGYVQTKLDQFAATSENLELKAKDLKAPEEFIKQNVQQFFVLVMTFRHTGLADLKPSLMNALEVTDTEVSSEPISRSLYYLTNSDFLYREVFVPKAKEILDAKKIKGVTVPTTKFLADPDIASKTRAQDILDQLKSAGNLQAVHGVEVSKVVAQPDDKEIKAGGTFNLQSSDQLVFVVSVENQGNMAEKDVPVKVTLLSPDSSTKPQSVTVKIPELKPKQKGSVDVKGLNPTPYGEVAVLKVEVGPVTGEKFLGNNSIQASVIFTL